MSGISYVVTVYDKRPYLPGVMAALAAQQGDFPREVIVVDDGSTDGSDALLQELGASLPGFRLIRQANQGPSAATNRGLAAASLPYVKFLDGDDLLAPYASAHLLDTIERFGADVAIGHGFDYRPGTCPDWPGARSDMAAILPDALARLIRSMWFGPTNLLVRREALLRSGGCDERIFVQDYSLALRLAAGARFAETPALISAGPAAGADPGRHLSSNKAQTLHDMNLALLLLLTDRPELAAGHATQAHRRIAARSWKWARRELHRPFWSNDALRALRAVLPGGGAACWGLLDLFTRDHPIRPGIAPLPARRA